MARTSPGKRPARRLFVEALEERAVPAFDLAIDGDAPTADVSTDTAADGTTTFTATGPLATLNAGDLATALAAGNVVVTTGDTGSGGGSISWVGGDAADDLTDFGAAGRTLTLRPDASATVGGVTIDGAHLTFADNVALVVDTSTTDGEIRLVNDARVNTAAAVTLNAGDGAVRIGSASPAAMAGSGDVVVTADTLQSLTDGFVLRSEQGDVTLNAPIDLDLAGLGVRADDGAVTLNGAVDGAGTLSLYGRPVTINGPVGGTVPLTTVTFAGGDATFTNTLTAATVEVGDNVFDAARATLSGAGPITGNVNVNFDGALAPGGAGATGQMSVVGDLTFLFGDYNLDLGPTPDRIDVTGNLTVVGGTLGSTGGTGVLPDDNPVPIITVGGSVAEDFDNAPLNTGLIVGTDAVRATRYEDGVGVTLARVPAAVGGTVTGTETDGTGYTVKLTGGGELAAFTDAAGQLGIAVRNSTAKTRVKITTKANASNATVALGRTVVNGDLADFNAATAVLAGSFTAAATPGTSGTVKALSFFQAFGTIAAPGAIGALTVRTSYFGAVNAAALGKVTVGQTLAGLAPWTVSGGIGSLTAAQIVGLDVTAAFLGTLTAKGDPRTDLSADIFQSTFRLTGDDGSRKAYGLKAVSAKGTVRGATFDVQAGNVGSVTVGRFVDSNLYVDYDPAAPFDAAGGFNTATPFRVEKFATTAATIGDPTNPVNWAFAGSRIAADTVGKVTLSGAKTASGGPVGIKFRSAGGSVLVKSSDSAAISPKVPLTASATAIANQFFYLDT